MNHRHRLRRAALAVAASLPFVRRGAGGLLLGLGGGAAVAGSYPEKPLRWIVPYPAGGGTDAVARVLTEAVQRRIGQPVVIENRPGAATNIAVSALLQAPPDGHTVMQAEAALIYNEHLYAKLPYKPESDFGYIGAIGRLPLALVVGASSPITTLAGFKAHIAAHPEQAHYAVPGHGTPHHLAMELFRQQAGLAMTLVPYQGAAPALQDLMSGRVTAMMLDLGSGLSALRAGKLRAIAVTSPQRSPALPEVPTFAELGMPQVQAHAFQGLVGPAGLPAEAVAMLNAALREAVHEPKVAAYFAQIGLESLALRPAEFKALARRESARWGEVIRSLGLRLD